MLAVLHGISDGLVVTNKPGEYGWNRMFQPAAAKRRCYPKARLWVVFSLIRPNLGRTAQSMEGGGKHLRRVKAFGEAG